MIECDIFLVGSALIRIVKVLLLLVVKKGLSSGDVTFAKTKNAKH